MAEHALSAEVRDGTGKGVNRKLRAQGKIPGVLYGMREAPKSIALDPSALNRLLHKSGAGLNTLIDLQVGGAQQTVLVKALQRDPVTGVYLHVDFYRLDLTRLITVEVPVQLVGRAKGLENGGILDHPLREIEVECLPTAIPERIEVDVSGLDVGDSLHVSDLVLPAGVTLKTDPALSVASVVLPASEEAAAPITTVVEGEEVPVEGTPETEEAAAAPRKEAAKKE
jgi:large subunit ribosomal protein L25